MSEPSPTTSLALTPRLVARLASRLAIVIGAFAAILFVPAGRVDWPEAWALLIGYSVFLILYGVWGLLKDPAQLQERSRTAANVKRWDKIIMGAYSVLLLATFVVAGIDAGRLHWSSTPPALRAAAWLALLAAGALIFWTLAVNTYLSRMVRIQSDRGHMVVTEGPYRCVRHPMYAGIIVLFLGAPIALGSWWAALAGALVGVLFVVRTALEDRTLQAELPGYAEYAREVRWRLLPGIW